MEEAATDEAATVLDRIARIRELDRVKAPAGMLLDELRTLVGEAEAWVRLEGDGRARRAVEQLGSSLASAELPIRTSAAELHGHGDRTAR